MPYNPLNLSDIYKSSAARPLNPLQMQQAMANKAEMARGATTRGILGGGQNPLEMAESLMGAGNLDAASAVLRKEYEREGALRKQKEFEQSQSARDTLMKNGRLQDEAMREFLLGDNVDIVAYRDRMGELGLEDHWEIAQKMEKRVHDLSAAKAAAKRGEVEGERKVAEEVRAVAARMVVNFGHVSEMMRQTELENERRDLFPGDQDWKDPLMAGQNVLNTLMKQYGESFDIGELGQKTLEAVFLSGGVIPEGLELDADGVPQKVVDAPSFTVVWDIAQGKRVHASNQQIFESEGNLAPVPLTTDTNFKERYDPLANGGEGANVLATDRMVADRRKAGTGDYTGAQNQRPWAVWDTQGGKDGKGGGAWVTTNEFTDAEEGRYLPNPTGVSMSFNAETGEFSYTQGSAGEMASATQRDIEQKILAAEDSYIAMRQTSIHFDDSFLEWGTRVAVKWTGIKSAMGWEEAISDEERAQASKYYAFSTNAIRQLNQYIHDVTGAQMSAAEIVRLSAGMPDPGTGIFDGDNPIEFKAKLDEAIRLAILARARYIHVKNEGLGDLDPDSLEKLISLDSMEGVMDTREKALEEQGLTGEEILTQLKLDFGL